jgi:two-component system LytT family response regulator
MLTAAIVDDEAWARTRLQRLLKMVAPTQIHVAATCVDVDDLLEKVAELQIDVLFLDIVMPGTDGFTALSRWQGPLPLVVFVTAFENYGVKAFDARAVDYLLKPISAERLREAVARIMQMASVRSETDAGAIQGRRVPLPAGKHTHFVLEHQIHSIEADRNYIEVHTQSGRFMLRRTLNSFLEELDSDAFCRVHRSVAVRRDAVRKLMPLGSGRYQLELIDGRNIISGRNYRDDVRRLCLAIEPATKG